MTKLVTVKYSFDEEGAFNVHLSKGNTKLRDGIWGFSTLPGNGEHRPVLNSTGELLTNIIGTCSRFCEGCAKDGGCYAWRDLKLHHNATTKAWSENTILLRNNKVFKIISDFIKNKNSKYLKTGDNKKRGVKIFRINTSGEIENLHQLVSWNDLALKHPEVKFAIYTKNYDVLGDFFNAYGDTAKNFIVNVSQWHHCADEFIEKYRDNFKFNIFEYDDSNIKNNTLSDEDKERLSKLDHCKAVAANGKHALDENGEPITCDQCLRCYCKTGKITAVTAH